MKLRNIVIYIFGPYRGTKKQIRRNIREARKIAIELWEEGFTVYCPHLNTAHFERDCSLTHEEIIEGDLQILERVDVLFGLAGWEYSSGSIIEWAHADFCNIPYFTDKDKLKEWAKDWIALSKDGISRNT